MASGIETFTVKTEALYEKVKESNNLFFLSSRDQDSPFQDTKEEEEDSIDKKFEDSMEDTIKKNGGKNG